MGLPLPARIAYKELGQSDALGVELETLTINSGPAERETDNVVRRLQHWSNQLPSANTKAEDRLVPCLPEVSPMRAMSNWTHTGTSYAVFVVEAGYEPRIGLDVLPRVGGPVLARTVVEGRK